MLALIVAGVAVLCLFALRPARTQSTGLRRISNTTEEGININPAISGDGKIVAFESTEDVAGAGGSDHFRAIRAKRFVEESGQTVLICPETEISTSAKRQALTGVHWLAEGGHYPHRET
jgi:hypothetical protein